VHEGDAVTSEKPLAQLDDSDYKRRVAGAKDQLAQVEAKQQAAAATVKAVQAKYERIKSLRDRGSVSQQSFDDILANRDASAAELEAARRQGGGAATALQQAEDDLAHCSLRLPIPTAVVSRKFIERGERVPAGQPVLEVMDLSQLRVAFGVPDTRVGKFQLGQSVAVSADAFRGERFSGRVTKIAPAADLRTRSFEVEVTIEQPRMLRPGMVVTIIVGRREEMTLTPMTAVQRGDNPNEFVVFAVVDEGGRKIARRRTVKIDGVYDNRIRLEEDKESGVGLGDMIVVTGAFRLADGLEVRVVDVPKAAIRIDEK
jgi:multidrug efflux system membrane fusion protein